MAAEDSTVFPAYRRMVGVQRYYMIRSPRAFTEVELIGERKLVHEVEATMYPELVRIRQMLDLADGTYAAITAEEWAAAVG
jgi:hypothetical protein